MPLTTTRAWALLRLHTANVRGQFVCESSILDADDLPMLQLYFPPFAREDGARMRLACDAVNALGACEGFAPTENPLFWRRVLLELLLPPASMQDHELPPFDSLAFSQFGVFDGLRLHDTSEREFWREFISCGAGPVTTDTSLELQRAREALAHELAPYVVRAVRPLTVMLTDTVYVSELRRSPERAFHRTLALETIERCCRDLHQLRTASIAMGGEHQLPLSPLDDLHIDYVPLFSIEYVEPKDTDTAALLKILNTFVVGGAPLTRVASFDFRGGGDEKHPTRVAKLRVACALTRSAPATPWFELRHTGKCVDCHAFCGARLSVVPHAVALTHVTFRLHDQREKLLRLAWLAYAVFHPKRRQPTRSRLLQALTIETEWTSLNQNEIQYLDAIVRTGLPLRDVVGVTLRNRFGPRSLLLHVDCYSFGTMAIVARGTALYTEPARSTPQYLVTTTPFEEEVDVVAHLMTKAHLTPEGFVGIVYPGAGLVWVQETAVVWTKPCPAWIVDAATSVGSLLTTSTLQLELEKAPPQHHRHVASPQSPLTLFLGPQLCSFTLLYYSPLTDHDLELLLALCPNLWHLEIRQCVIQSLWPLVDAYTAEPQPCRVSSLRLASTGRMVRDSELRNVSRHSGPAQVPIIVTPINVFGPLTDALCDATHPLTQRLRVLHVDLRGTAQEDQAFHQLTRALDNQTTRLEVLSVKTQATSASHVARALSRHRDREVVDATRMRWALLSVLRARGWWLKKRALDVGVASGDDRGGDREDSLDEPTLRTVFAFAGGTVVRRISWRFQLLRPAR